MSRHTSTSNPVSEISAIVERVARDAAERAASETARALEVQIKLARGTRDIATRSVYWIGDETDTPTLIDTIEQCIGDRPRTRQELIELTGARGNRINGALVKLQLRRPVKNLGDSKKAVWYAPPARAKYDSKRER